MLLKTENSRRVAKSKFQQISLKEDFHKRKFPRVEMISGFHKKSRRE
jgi:hypothetical protein